MLVRSARWLLLAALLVAPWASACSGGAPPPPAPTAAPAAVAGGGGAALPTATPAALRFRAATMTPPAAGAHLLPYWVGIEAGIFRQYGLAVELMLLQSDQMALTAAANGEVDVVIGTPGPTLLAVIAGGIDAVILGATHNAFDSHLLAAQDVTTPADLVGRSVVISAKGTLNDWATREALQRLGVDPDLDLAGWWTGANQAERIEHLRLGNGQATVVPPPLSGVLAREGFTDFGDLSDGAPWPGVAIIAARRVYFSRYDQIQRFLRGLLASIQRTKADPALAKQTLVKYTRLDDPAAIDEAYAVYGERLLERVPYLSREGLQRSHDFALSARRLTRRLPLDSLVDQTTLERLEASGFVDQLYR